MEEPSDACRLCCSPLQGSQRRWLFHRPPQRPDLRVLLTHVCREAPRRGDGRGEFLCGKCAQALGRVFRFDAVIARVQALSLARLRRLLEEKERLARCLRHLHARRSPEGPQPPAAPYQRLLRDDLALAGFECWAEPGAGGTRCPNRWCPGCHGLRVPDAEYEGVCGTPRRLGAGSPALPLCRDKSRSLPLVLRAGLGGAGGQGGSLRSLRSASLGSGSLLSLAGPEPLGEALRALEGVGRRGIRVPRGSRIPVLARRAAPPTPSGETEEEEEEEEEEIEDEFIPLGVKALGGRRRWALTETLAAAEEELRRLRVKTGGSAPEDAGVPSAPGEGLLGGLTPCLHSKEAALQRTLLAALEQGQQERGGLRGALQDKDRDLGRLAAALRTGEETMNALRETLAQRELERAHLASLWGRAQETWRRRDQTRALALQEMGEAVTALRAALARGTEELEVLAEAPGAPGLLQRLREQGGLLAERGRLAAEMDARLQGALEAQAAVEQELRQAAREAAEEERGLQDGAAGMKQTL